MMLTSTVRNHARISMAADRARGRPSG
jgi:hypothetical protein